MTSLWSRCWIDYIILDLFKDSKRIFSYSFKVPSVINLLKCPSMLASQLSWYLVWGFSIQANPEKCFRTHSLFSRCILKGDDSLIFFFCSFNLYHQKKAYNRNFRIKQTGKRTKHWQSLIKYCIKDRFKIQILCSTEYSK